MIPEINIWRAASLLLKRYGEKALEESAARADELCAPQDHNGAAVWRRIIDAAGQLANTTPSDHLESHSATGLTRPACPSSSPGLLLKTDFFGIRGQGWHSAAADWDGASRVAVICTNFDSGSVLTTGFRFAEDPQAARSDRPRSLQRLSPTLSLQAYSYV
jgi:hypothetical protein